MSNPASRNVLADLRENCFRNTAAACHYLRIVQSFLEYADDEGAAYAFSVAKAYFQAAERDFAPLRDIVDLRRDRQESGG